MGARPSSSWNWAMSRPLSPITHQIKRGKEKEGRKEIKREREKEREKEKERERERQKETLLISFQIGTVVHLETFKTNPIKSHGNEHQPDTTKTPLGHYFQTAETDCSIPPPACYVMPIDRPNERHPPDASTSNTARMPLPRQQQPTPSNVTSPARHCNESSSINLQIEANISYLIQP